MNTTISRGWGCCGVYDYDYLPPSRPKPKTLEQQIVERKKALQKAVEDKQKELSEAKQELKTFNATLASLL
jgi:hypothetical protein